MPSLRKAQIPDPRPVREISKPDQTPTSPQLSKTPEQVIVLLGPVKEA